MTQTRIISATLDIMTDCAPAAIRLAEETAEATGMQLIDAEMLVQCDDLTVVRYTIGRDAA